MHFRPVARRLAGGPCLFEPPSVWSKIRAEECQKQLHEITALDRSVELAHPERSTPSATAALNGVMRTGS